MAANPERGEVDFVVGDRDYVLALTTNDICAIQARTGKTYGELVLALSRLDGIAIRDLLWTALQRHHRSEFLKADQVGLLMDQIGGIVEAVAPLRALAVVNQRPAVKGEPAPDFQAAPSGISGHST